MSKSPTRPARSTPATDAAPATPTPRPRRKPAPSRGKLERVRRAPSAREQAFAAAVPRTGRGFWDQDPRELDAIDDAAEAAGAGSYGYNCSPSGRGSI